MVQVENLMVNIRNLLDFHNHKMQQSIFELIVKTLHEPTPQISTEAVTEITVPQNDPPIANPVSDITDLASKSDTEISHLWENIVSNIFPPETETSPCDDSHDDVVFIPPNITTIDLTDDHKDPESNKELPDWVKKELLEGQKPWTSELRHFLMEKFSGNRRIKLKIPRGDGKFKNISISRRLLLSLSPPPSESVPCQPNVPTETTACDTPEPTNPTPNQSPEPVIYSSEAPQTFIGDPTPNPISTPVSAEDETKISDVIESPAMESISPVANVSKPSPPSSFLHLGDNSERRRVRFPDWVMKELSKKPSMWSQEVRDFLQINVRRPQKRVTAVANDNGQKKSIKSSRWDSRKRHSVTQKEAPLKKPFTLQGTSYDLSTSDANFDSVIESQSIPSLLDLAPIIITTETSECMQLPAPDEKNSESSFDIKKKKRRVVFRARFPEWVERELVNESSTWSQDVQDFLRKNLDEQCQGQVRVFTADGQIKRITIPNRFWASQSQSPDSKEETNDHNHVSTTFSSCNSSSVFDTTDEGKTESLISASSVDEVKSETFLSILKEIVPLEHNQKMTDLGRRKRKSKKIKVAKANEGMKRFKMP